MKRLFIYAMTLGYMGITSCGNNSNTDSKEVAKADNEKKFDNSNIEKDAEFAVKAADGGMLEVALGKLALTNAASAEVKQFGQMMIDDHSKAGEELKAVASTKNITMPAALSNDHQKIVEDFSKKTGADFDKDYISLMVDDHEDDIKEFKREVENGKDAELKAWAAGKISTLEDHLGAAKNIKENIRKNK